MLQAIFAELARANIQYALVGGLAVTLHGHLRSTADVDIVLAMDTANLARFVSHFKASGWQPVLPLPFEALLDDNQRLQWVNERNLKVFAIYQSSTPSLTLDILLVTPQPIEQIVARALSITTLGYQVMVASVADIIEMKLAVGRKIDLSDVFFLKALDPK
jgi:hypothetical protein